MEKSSPKEYLSNKDFQALVEKHLLAPDDMEIKCQLTLMFLTLAKNIVNGYRFQHIDFEDAIQESVLLCLMKVKGFDPARGKSFNYFTTIILNNLRHLYRKGDNYENLKQNYSNRIKLAHKGSRRIKTDRTS